MSINTYRIIAGKNRRFLDSYLERGIIGIGFAKTGSLAQYTTREAIKEELSTQYPQKSSRTIANWAGQVNLFLNTMQVGERVIVYDAPELKYYVGLIQSPAEIDESGEQYFIRSVKWLPREIQKQEVSEGFRNSTGAISTVMQLWDRHALELERLLSTDSKPLLDETETDELEQSVPINIEEMALEQISLALSSLDFEQMQDLVAGILRAMGYKTIINGSGGPDGGYDVLASSNSFMLGTERIKAEVKHRGEKMNAQQVRSFLGILHSYEKGLYVSTGGFTKDARDYERSSQKPLSLIDKQRLIELIIEYYEQFDSETQALLPLKKIYTVQRD